MQVVKVVCEGITPLLMEPMSDELLESLRTGNRLAPDKKSDAHTIASRKIYERDGVPGIPADNVWACLVEGGRLVPFKGKSKISTATDSLLGGLMRIEEEFLPLKNGGPIEWKVDKRRGCLPGDGTAVCLVRPKFTHWGFEATLHIDDAEVDDSKIEELFKMAGKFKGLGGHRKKGSFGRFTVTSFTTISGGGKQKNAGKKVGKGAGKNAVLDEGADNGEGGEPSDEG